MSSLTRRLREIEKRRADRQALPVDEQARALRHALCLHMGLARDHPAWEGRAKFRLSPWLPGPDDDPMRRYWAKPQEGDIVLCRFPDFLQGAIERSCVKVRPCLVTGYEATLTGAIAVTVAYGTTHGHQVHHPGEGLMRYRGEFTVDPLPGTGLEAPTAFNLRLTRTLDFTPGNFPPAPHPSAVHPRMGSVPMGDAQVLRDFKRAVAEMRELGSALRESDGRLALIDPTERRVHDRCRCA